MSEVVTLICWKCGERLPDSDFPIARNDVCLACQAELHVCKMCEFYDQHVSESCREPTADSVANKERANFCGYFKAKSLAFQPADSDAQAASLAQLNALFEGNDEVGRQNESLEEGEISANDKAKQQLNDLFGSD